MRSSAGVWWSSCRRVGLPTAYPRPAWAAVEPVIGRAGWPRLPHLAGRGVADGVVAAGWMVFDRARAHHDLVLAKPGETHPSYHGALYAMDTLLPVVDLRQQGVWVPRGGCSGGRGRRSWPAGCSLPQWWPPSPGCSTRLAGSSDPAGIVRWIAGLQRSWDGGQSCLGQLRHRVNRAPFGMSLLYSLLTLRQGPGVLSLCTRCPIRKRAGQGRVA
jgi:hypothetical protein